MKIRVGPSSNLGFQPATDRGTSAQITVTQNNATKVTFSSGGGGGGSSASGELAYAQANAAYDQANTAITTANGAYSQANGAYSQANGAYGQANGAYTQANGAYSQANGAYAQANGAYAQANLSYAQANAGYSQANAAYLQANSARDQANTAYGQANAAYDAANTRVLRSGDTMTGILNVASTIISQNIIPNLNLTYDLGNTTNRFNDLYLGGNSVYIGDAVLSTNGDTVLTNTFVANVSFLSGGLNVLNQANAAYDAANNAGINALNAYTQANNSRDQANTARTTANDAYEQANSARTQANNAYAEANLKLNITGGTINGSLNVSGNLTITGNTKYVNVETYIVTDPLIYLAANNDTSDIIDIGFMGGKNTAGQYSHTGLVRDAGDGTWYLFDNLLEEGHENNVVDFANTTLATLRANINANSILLVGETVATQANLTIAYNQANTARTTANDSYGQANAARDQANTARGTANDAYGAANSSITIGQNAYGQANAARNTANDSYGQANTARDQANTARTQANAAYSQANAAYGDANTRVLKSGDTMTGALTITTTGIGLTVANANVTGNLNVGTQIVTGGSSGDISGVNTIYASTFSSGGINVTLQAADAYAQANSGRNQANTAYGQANVAYNQANTARDQANTARSTANDAYLQANNAYDKANAATVRISANNASIVTTPNINFVNTSTVTVSVVAGDNGNANISFASSGGSIQYTYNTTTTSTETVDSWSASIYRSGKYQMQVENLYGFAALEIMLLHDGVSTNLVRFGESTFGNVGSFSSDISGGLVRLRFTAADPTSALTYYRSLLETRGSESLPTDLMTGTLTYDLMTSIPISPTDLNA